MTQATAQTTQTIHRRPRNPAAPAVVRPRLGLFGTYLELAKARLTALVLVTTAVGFMLAGVQPVAWYILACTILGTALTASAANGLNQCLEASGDARMLRTCSRPVAAHRISRRHACIWSLCTGAAGLLLLGSTANLLTAALAAGAILLYVLVYTPLKQRNPVCTLVGAVVGALPPMIGWSAAAGSLDAGAWVLGAILLIWQIPHSLALAWLYREDYARGGYHILSWNDPRGRTTFHMIVLYSLCLLPVSMTPYPLGLAGPWYMAGAIGLGIWLLVLALRLQCTGQDAHARSLFKATVIYLPALLGLLLANRL